MLQNYEARLLRYAHRVLGDWDQAHDVVQETFLKLCRQDSSELNGRLAQWLYTVCRNHALDIKRKESRMNVAVNMEMTQAEPARPQLQRLELADESARVLEAVEELTDAQQDCLRLKFQEGMSYREISGITGMSVSSVGFTLHTALKILRQRLGNE